MFPIVLVPEGGAAEIKVAITGVGQEIVLGDFCVDGLEQGYCVGIDFKMVMGDDGVVACEVDVGIEYDCIVVVAECVMMYDVVVGGDKPNAMVAMMDNFIVVYGGFFSVDVKPDTGGCVTDGESLYGD